MYFLLTFFTTWCVLLVALHNNLYKSINLLYVSFVTCVIGTYFSLYNPRYFEFEWKNKIYKVDGWKKFFLADITHILPFLIIYCLYYKYYKTLKNILPNINAILILIIYLNLYNVKNVYDVSFMEVSLVFIVASILYSLIIFIP
jgi:hypothetical protein